MVRYSQSIGDYTSETVEICTKEGIDTTVFDEYFKVSAVAGYAGSEDSGQSNLFWDSRRRKSSAEFGNIFRIACDELKEQSGGTHQTPGHVPAMGVAFTRVAFSR